MQLSRRQILALAATAPALAAVGTGAVGLSWWTAAPDTGMQCLSASEAAFVRAFSGAAWPATAACPVDGAEADLDHFVDAQLTTLGSSPRKAIRMGFQALDHLCLPSHAQRFADLARGTQQDVLEDWLSSDLMSLRSAVLGIVVLVGMGYTIHPDTADTFAGLYRCWYGQ